MRLALIIVALLGTNCLAQPVDFPGIEDDAYRLSTAVSDMRDMMAADRARLMSEKIARHDLAQLQVYTASLQEFCQKQDIEIKKLQRKLADAEGKLAKKPKPKKEVIEIDSPVQKKLTEALAKGDEQAAMKIMQAMLNEYHAIFGGEKKRVTLTIE